jgi:hypothetical protein
MQYRMNPAFGIQVNAGEDEKELVLEYTFLPRQSVSFFCFLLLTDLITPAAAAVIAEHAKTNSCLPPS